MGKLTNLNPVTEASLPPEMTRDTELVAALLKALTLFARSSSIGAIDGNNTPINAAAGFMWVDGNAAHANLPASAGLLIEFDPLRNTVSQGLYRAQIMIPLTTVANGTVFHVRHQNNGAWASWRML
ncbi:hypothetical protein QUB56_35790 [Microcoleus sp. AR_TQ3_B6]|uniref:hypothetical protein n=1 Tax=Microcoleus sp. AR_TQ3_B6 TaxID=3055284 RepID=UPI002FD02E21